MMIRGLSYQRGIFFIGKMHVACAYHENGRLKTWIKPYETKTMLVMMRQIISAMPMWFTLIAAAWVSLVIVPKLTTLIDASNWTGLPVYTLFYLMLGTHFIFPESLKKYHGAEHKVFSDRGVKRRGRMYRIKKAAITNRNCSTNVVVIYFLSVIVTVIGLYAGGWQWSEALMYGSYGSLLAIPVVQQLMKYKAFRWLKSFILAISYWLQVKVTTSEPEHKHIICAIESYRKLAKEEFPQHLVEKRVTKKKEEKHMAIVDVTVIPIGTESPSVSQYVAEIQQVLAKYEGKITYELTPMSTLIEGELPVLFEVIQAIHEVPFKHGLKRVATNIRIDDRRDKESTLSSKRASVQARLEQTEEK
nr:MTH1187 family thiamine-binding protein [Bacillus sp. FJAT-45037]